uniref:Spindle assembly abnormal protein 6 N-terminal domain-containing protein n=1 Tax=Lygus hesperus TaxID=30085 RepID=A0A0A9X5D1_LYGHE
MFYPSARDDPSSSDPMYSSQQRFYIKNGFGEERPRDLRINVNLSSAYSAPSKHVLNIQVLDDDDPFFFYSLAVTEEDYLRLKSSQGLLVDFDNFPTQVVRLLEQCKNQGCNPAKFLLLLEEEGRGEFSKTMLKIVETNNFKHLCHLVLQIDHGSDEEIKKIMVRKIKALKDQNFKAEKAVSSLESQLSSKNMLLDAAERKVNEIENRWKEDKMSYQAEAARGVTDEAEKMRRAQLDWQIKAQREKAEVEEKFQSIIREKDAELSKLRIDSQISYDKRSHAEATMSEQGKRIEVLERELTSVRGDLGNTRKQLAKMENQLHEKDRTISNLKGKLTVAEQESKEKTI